MSIKIYIFTFLIKAAKMQITIEIPEYDSSIGLKYSWINNFFIEIKKSDHELRIKANKEGLTSLAIQLLNLAQDAVPLNHHIHLDEYNSLEAGSDELIIEKIS